MKIHNITPVVSAFFAGAALGCTVAYAIFKKKMDEEIAKRAADIISTCEKIKKIHPEDDGADGPEESELSRNKTILDKMLKIRAKGRTQGAIRAI